MLPAHRYLEEEVDDAYIDDIYEEEVYDGYNGTDDLSNLNEEGVVSYEGYIATTNHNPHLFIIAVIICAISIVAIPLLVNHGRRHVLSTQQQAGTGKGKALQKMGEEDGDYGLWDPRTDPHTKLSWVQRLRLELELALEEWLKWFRVDCYHNDTVLELGHDPEDGIAETAEREKMSDDRRPEIMPSPAASLKSRCKDYLLRKSLLLKFVFKYDNETKRLLDLVVPFFISTVVGNVADLIILAIIARYLGEDAMLAYVMVDIFTGISDSFLGGIIEALSSLGSMAYGARNYELAGQYLQGSIIIYVICEIPMMIFWGIVTDKLILWMGFDESVAALAASFVWLYMPIQIMEGINEAFLDFLEVVDREAYANSIYCISSVFETIVVAFFAIKMNASLNFIGHVMLALEILFFFFNVVTIYLIGWLEKFETGLFTKFALTNRPAMETLFKTALPLSLGSVFFNAEWEIFLLFASMLGPAEAATWAILGFVWDLFDSTTEALADAAEVRCAFQLGKGRPALAKLSAHKAMAMALMMSLLVTTVFMSLRNVIPGWLTPDGTLQYMLADLFPLVGLGNITMSMGSVAWSVIGAQGQYRPATFLACVCSVFITIPIAAITTMSFRIDLQGLIFAIVVGYTITVTLLFTAVLLSDWERLSNEIQDKMASKVETDEDTESENSSYEGRESSSYKAPGDIRMQRREGGYCSDDSYEATLIHDRVMYAC